MTARIDIYGPISKLTGTYPTAAIRTATSYAVKGAEFSKHFRKGLWDGRKHLFKPTGAFPTGLLPVVQEVLQAAEVPVEIHDHRPNVEPQGRTYDLVGVKMEGKYDYQLDAAKKAVEAKQGILRIATNGGKCVGLDTPIRCYDGSIKLAKNVVVGDQLMGPDSKPRTVLSTCRGVGPLYRIDQKRGMSYVCNDVHVLTLQDTCSKRGNQIIDIPLNEYLGKDKYFKHCFKHFSVGVEYPEQPLPVDPYLVGLWLGDGSKTFRGDNLAGIQITTKDTEIAEFLHQQAALWNLKLVEYEKKSLATTYALSRHSASSANALLTQMRGLFPRAELRIPQQYLIASRESRLKLLAGLIDSDGHYVPSRAQYELTLKSKALCTDVYMLCRSLGYGVAPPKSKKVKWPDGSTLEYWRIHIRGVSVDNPPPTLLEYKRAKITSKKCATRTNFEVTPIGVGDYAGFTLDGDGRFLLADYTVTHNTEIACAITQYLKLPTIFMVTTRELLYQSRLRFSKRLGLPLEEIGIVGDGNWQPGAWVTVATVDTLESRFDRQECQDLLKSTQVLFMDECHHLGSETWYDVSTSCPATYRFGLSGTPMDRTDGASLRLIAAIGPVIVDIPNKFLVDRGISARTHVIFSKITSPVLPKKLAYASAYKQGVVENPIARQLVVDWTKIFYECGLSTLILCEEIAHGKAIDEALWTGVDGNFIPHLFIHGEESTDVRASALKDFGERRLPVLIASTILDEGVDVPTIDALILAGSRQSRIKTMQRLGRGLRGSKLIAVEFANFTNDHLLRHSLTRYEDYKKEECFPLYQSGPDAELVKKLWNAP